MSVSQPVATNLKGKRKKKLPPNANPLFTRWLTEWKEEAAEKGWKSVHTYAKALKTLKLFPLPLETGRDCRLLQNFGIVNRDKICKMLDEKLAEYKQKQAVSDSAPASSSGFQSVSDSDEEASSQTSRVSNHSHQSPRKKKAPRANVTHTASSVESSNAIPNTLQGTTTTAKLHDISDNSDSEIEAVPPPQKKKARSGGTRNRQYVPAYRSGPYALILTLYKYMQDPEFKGYMTKTELSHTAQPLSDKSFTIPEPGSHYTAWSSMGTLIKKGFIMKANNPARYSLTDTGFELGKQLDRAEKQGSVPENDIISQETNSSQDRLSDPVRADGEQQLTNGKERRYSDTSNLSEPIMSSPVQSTQLNNISNIEDDDLERAIAESLLSYSQELSMRSSFSSQSAELSAGEANSPNTIQQHKNADSSNTASLVNDLVVEKAIFPVVSQINSNSSIGLSHGEPLIVSDEEDSNDKDENIKECQILPKRPRARFHSLSPSPSPPPHSCLSALTSASAATAAPQPLQMCSSTVLPKNNDTSKYTNSSYGEQHSVKITDQDVMEISDDSDTEHDHAKRDTQQLKEVSFIETFESDDELPELDLPLSKRLLQRGHIESDLLKASVTSLIPPATASLPTASTAIALQTIDKQVTSHTESGKGDNLHTTPSCFSKPATNLVDASHPCRTACDISSESSSATSLNVMTVYQQALDIADEDHIQANYIRKGSDTARTTDMQSQNSNFQSSQTPSATLSTALSSSTSTSAPACIPDFTLQPGSFDIVLCLDNREFYGSKSSSKTLLPDLMKSGVQCDLRLLHVGDLLWIARERVGNHFDRTKGRELVLHYIIERKRMDDLVSSMTDGRMKEQKFRLKHCGLSEPIILIEEYGSIQNFSLSEDRIKQSIVNSQIIDGFKVKRCGSMKDAVTYLAMMTRFLQQYYSTKTLHAVSLEYLKCLKGQQPLNNKEHYLIPFDAFNEASIKHKDLTVRELFAKQLIQVPGVSADRARAITNVYPIITRLLEAYEKCESDKERENLLAKIKCGKTERNLGIAVSRTLCMLYTQKGSLS